MHLYNLENVHPEVRAYIYQQLADLEQFIPDGSAVSVLINDQKTNSIVANIRISTPYGELNALEESENIFDSLTKAKITMIKRLEEFQRSLSENEAGQVQMSEIKKVH